MVLSSIEGNICRITCDIDDKDMKSLIHCLKTFRRYGFTEKISLRESPSGRGWHVVSWSEKGVPLKKLIKIRRKAGDDKIRCDLDSRSGRQIQVLFSSKKKIKLG